MLSARFFAFILISFLLSYGWAVNTNDSHLEKLVQHLRHQKPITTLKTIQVHSEKIAKLIKENYSASDIKRLENVLQSAVAIKIHEDGIVQAADRPSNSLDDPTHYNAVWLRDTLWVYLGLKSQGRSGEAKNLLLKMMEYLGSEDQLKRFSKVIENPSIVNGPSGSMEVVHIRFDGSSTTFKDIQINGAPQKWNHKQNDALGLFFDLFLRAIQDKSISTSDLKGNHYKVLVSLPAYFSKIKYYDMEDAGSWEEIEKINTSSVGLVTSSLETFLKILGSRTSELTGFRENLKDAAQKLNLTSALEILNIKTLVDQGYNRIFKQLDKGGESPLYSTDDKRFRKADAALLNLIYPAELSRLDKAKKTSIIKMVAPLIGDVGIRRYIKDSYQSGNFWFHMGNTDDTSSSENFSNRGKSFMESSEAQWFFDSWFSKCSGLLSKKNLEILHFNRALAQLTGEDSLGADGKPVPAFALPESYNSIFFDGNRYFAPSPITPLNWAKASLLIALDQLKLDLK